ncbi:DegT/DnrJ/EryC1/StrS family aminotransferase [Lentzea sp. NPDC051838]|uniref:DegT/DnrJ/EryC1/StrS family aminotransferase n=1 Tax=Lentzea sp. NPDC051838 TaxID=3154849 RepID=UPI003424FF8E
MINVSQPSLGFEELAAVQEVFASNWIGKGARVDAFEAAFAEHIGVGSENVATLNSCTEALFLSMQLLGIGPGDDVVLPTLSFVAQANAIAAHGARPVFCDVDPRTQNPTLDDVKAALTPRTKAVMVLHFGGLPGEVREIAEFCRARGIYLIEDSANSVASRVDGQACGTFGDIGAWSFDYAKMVVAVDGGMIYARDPALIERARRISFFGLEQESNSSQAERHANRWWDIEVGSFGRRTIMNDVHAAVGHVQLGKLPSFVAHRKLVTERYNALLADVPGVVTPPPPPPGHENSYYFYWIQLPVGLRDQVAKELYARSIYTTYRYTPLHQVKAYGSDVSLPKAEQAAECTLNLPIHQALTESDVDTVVTALREVMAAHVL